MQGAGILGIMLLPVAGIYAAVSVLTLAIYAWDKAAARRGGRRVPEATLHLLELLGGWPGALLGQRLLRHKNAKASYQVVFWGIVFFHAAVWAVWLRWSEVGG